MWVCVSVPELLCPDIWSLSTTLWTMDVLQIAGMADPASYLYGRLIEGIRPNRYTCKQKWPFRLRRLEVLALCRVSLLERRPTSFGRRNGSLQCRKNWSQQLRNSLPLRSIHLSLAGRVYINTFTAIVDFSRFNNSCLKSPASTLVDLTFQSRALRSFSLNQLRNLSL